MIPKIIHYCWFGRNPLPQSAIKCIESWKKFLPDYEIKEWNEDNFDINMIPYIQEAYEAKKYAFVSDYARFWILYNYGGLYFDTDVEVVKDMSAIISAGPYMGCELDDGTVNPGLGLGADSKMPVYKTILGNYLKMRFLNADGTRNSYTMIPMVTELLRANGLSAATHVQDVLGLKIYPVDYFNPLDDATGRLKTTVNTHSIHWYMASWQTSQTVWLKVVKQFLRRILYAITLTKQR